MDLGGFSCSSRWSVLGYSHDWPGWVYGLDLLIQLIKFVIREYMEPLSPGHTEFVQLGTNLTRYKRLVTANHIQTTKYNPHPARFARGVYDYN